MPLNPQSQTPLRQTLVCLTASAASTDRSANSTPWLPAIECRSEHTLLKTVRSLSNAVVLIPARDQAGIPRVGLLRRLLRMKTRPRVVLIVDPAADGALIAQVFREGAEAISGPPELLATRLTAIMRRTHEGEENAGPPRSSPGR